MNRNCKHCHQQFAARRKNHMYCCTSCKSMASYKRNNYKYISGHYQKQVVLIDNIKSMSIPQQELTIGKDQIINSDDKKQKTINSKDILSSAIGTMAGETAIYTAKRIFYPNSITATKGDILTLIKKIEELKAMIMGSNHF